jgi:hypothetical protein
LNCWPELVFREMMDFHGHHRKELEEMLLLQGDAGKDIRDQKARTPHPPPHVHTPEQSRTPDVAPTHTTERQALAQVAPPAIAAGTP